MPTLPLTETQAFYQIGAIHAADGTAIVNWISQQNNFRQIDSLLAINSDAIGHVLLLNLNNGSSGAVEVGSCTVPARAGYDGNPATDLYVAAFPLNFPVFVFDSLWFLQASVAVAMTGATVMTLVAIGGYV